MLDPNGAAFDLLCTPKMVNLDDNAFWLLQQIKAREAGGFLTSPITRSAEFYTDIALGGVCYTTSSFTFYCDLHIMFSDHSRSNGEFGFAGCIQFIFCHRQVSTTGDQSFTVFVLVQEYCPLPPELGFIDHFRKFGILGGFICDIQPTTWHLLKVAQVLSHVGLTETILKNGDNHLKVNRALPVDRVRESLWSLGNHC